MAKQLLFGAENRTQILAGVEKLANAVSATMGPLGRNVAIARQWGGPTVTKDGVTVAKEITLPDAFENIGAQLVKEAATKTNDAAGDGTTTATVLAHAIMQAGMKHITAGKNAISIKNGIMKAVAAVTAQLETMAQKIKKVEEYSAVATISAQDAEIGKVVGGIVHKVGAAGVVTVEAGQTLGIEEESVEGMQFDQGYISPYFVTDTATMKAELEKPFILVTDRRITSFTQILPMIEALSKAGHKQLVIIAEGIDNDALALLVLNNMRGTFSTLAVKAPAFGDRRKEMLKDIAALTGATVISEELGLKLENVTFADLGTARRVVATKDDCTIIDGDGEKAAIEQRVTDIKAQLETSKSDFDKEKLRERLAKLTGGIAVLKVGAATEVEQKEKQHRVEDAVSATQAAASEGIVAGGGTAYVRCAAGLNGLIVANEDEMLGVQIVAEALLAPCRTIANNAGVEGIVEEVQKLDGDMGYNAMTKEYEDLVAAMVIDPKKVTRCALENAASVAAMFLTLEASIVDIPEPKNTAEQIA